MRGARDLRPQHERVRRVDDRGLGRRARTARSGCAAYHWSSWSSPATSTAAARRPVRPARPACWRIDASVPGKPLSTTASSPPTSMPSSSAFVAATPSRLPSPSRVLELAPLLGQVAGAVRGDPVGRARGRRPGAGAGPAPRRAPAPRRLRVNASVGRPSRTNRASSSAVSAFADDAPPGLLVEQRPLPEPEAALGLRRAVVVDRGDRLPAQRVGELGRVADRRAREAERRARPVVRAHPLEPAQHVRDVAAEDPAQRVQLVDHDEPQPHEERRPAPVVREDPLVQHLGVGEHDVRVLAGPGPVVGRRVAVVGHGVQARAPATTAATAAGPARAPWSGTSRSAVSGSPRDDRVDDRQLVAERLPGRGAGGDHDVARRSCSASIAAAWWVQSSSMPAGGEPLHDLGVQRAGRAGGAGLAGRQRACGRRADRRARGRPRSSESVSQASSPSPDVTPDAVDAYAITVALVTLQHRVVGEVGEERRGAGAERELGAAAGRDRDHDVADVRRVDREAEAAQRVEVVEADALELRVAAEVGEQLQRADRARCSRPGAGRAPEMIR